MYPSNYFALIPPFPRTDQAFVAMSFDTRFDRRWTEVLSPGLGRISREGNPLTPFRVDLSKKSDAILTEILEAIGDSRVIVADITATAEPDGKAFRNANVMYEIGIAHAARLPEEVVLFRSDNLHLDFDIAGVRVHSYDPDSNPTAACQFVTDTVIASLNALQARRRTILRVAAERLTLSATNLLMNLGTKEQLTHPETRTMAQAVSAIEQTQAIQLLLELGAIKSKFFRITEAMLTETESVDPAVLNAAMVHYTLSDFGLKLQEYVGGEMGAFEPYMEVHFQRLMGSRRKHAV